MTLKTRLSVLFISTPVLAFVVVGGLMGKNQLRRASPTSTCGCSRMWSSLVMSSYVEPVKVDRVMEGAMRGLADGLDPDSAVLSAKQVRALESGETLPDGDVGIELTRQYYLRVISARDGSPAPRPACRPATTSGPSTAPRPATCRCSRAAGCCAVSRAARWCSP